MTQKLPVARVFLKWLESQPDPVRQLAAEFPIGSVLSVKGGTWYVIGWSEGDELFISQTWLGDDYDKAIEERELIHASHVRNGQVPVALAEPLR